MARISRNSYDRTKNRIAVTQQIGIPVVDADFNEGMKILQVQDAEHALASFSALRATTSGMLRRGFASNDDFKPYASGTSAIFITRGTLFVDGFQLVLAADLDLTTVGLSFPSDPSDLFGFIYVDLVIGEMDSTGDPSIAIPNLGETSVRQVLTATWGQSESSVSYQAAFNAITALPVVTNPTVWKGNTARVFIAKYRRTSETAIIGSDQVMDLRQATPVEMAFKQRFVKFHKPYSFATPAAEGSHGNGMVVWDGNIGRLQIGNRNVSSDADEALGAASIVMPGAPRHRLAKWPATEWLFENASNTDGTPIPYASSDGWTMADGYALGFLPTAFLTNANTLGDNPTKLGAQADVQSIEPAPATQNPLTQYTLTVQTLATFAAASSPGTFILCYRMGRDLVWWNGHVTRASLSQPVFDDPTQPVSSDYHLVLGQDGPCHGSAKWSLETGLNVLADGGGAGTFGTGRSAIVKVGAGLWEFARGVKKYGLESEGLHASGTQLENTFQLHGKGPSATTVRFYVTPSSTRSTSDVAEMEISRNEVVIKDIYFNVQYDANHRPGYVLKITARDVILENCIFPGPVFIKANNITIRNCRFEAVGGSTVQNWQQDAGSLVAGFLRLSDVSVANYASSWLIEDCDFSAGLGFATTFHSSVILEPAARTKCVFRNCNFEQNSNQNTAYPASGIAVQNGNGFIHIDDCRFIGAIGAPKTGTAALTVIGTANDYNGSLLTNAFGALYTAAAYISATAGRLPNSSLRVTNCFFSHGNIGNSYGPVRFPMYAAMAVICNTQTLGTTSGQYNNIWFTDNHVQMWPETTQGWGTDTASSKQPCIYGFIMTPDVPHGVGLTDYFATNINVERNFFDLGGHDGLNSAWRSIVGPAGSWSTSGNFPYYTSACVTVMNGQGEAGGSLSSYTGRTTRGVRINDNQLLQRPPNGAAALSTALGALSDTNLATPSVPPASGNNIWAFIGISVSSFYGTYSQGTAGGSETGTGYLSGCKISGNTIVNVAFTANSDGHYVGIFSHGYATLISDNVICLPDGATGPRGTFAYDSDSFHSGNRIRAYTGIHSGGGFAANNLLNATTHITGGPDEQYSVSTENFKE